jgi:hypothetical protein
MAVFVSQHSFSFVGKNSGKPRAFTGQAHSFIRWVIGDTRAMVALK